MTENTCTQEYKVNKFSNDYLKQLEKALHSVHNSKTADQVTRLREDA